MTVQEMLEYLADKDPAHFIVFGVIKQDDGGVNVVINIGQSPELALAELQSKLGAVPSTTLAA